MMRGVAERPNAKGEATQRAISVYTCFAETKTGNRSSTGLPFDSSINFVSHRIFSTQHSNKSSSYRSNSHLINMTEQQKRPTLIDPDSEDEAPATKRQKTTDVAGWVHKSKLSILHAALVSIMTLEEDKANEGLSSLSCHDLASPILHPLTTGIKIPTVVHLVDARKDLVQHILEVSTKAAAASASSRPQQEPTEFKGTLTSLGPLPSGKPLCAPPRLPRLGFGEGLKRQARR